LSLDRKREFIENRDKQVQENKKDNTSSSKRREKKQLETMQRID
jgi:hypothetical protein